MALVIALVGYALEAKQQQPPTPPAVEMAARCRLSLSLSGPALVADDVRR
jgi:hypothetical protein